MPVIRSLLKPRHIPGLQSLGDFQGGVGGGNEFRAGGLQPAIKGHVVFLQVESAQDDVLNALPDLFRRIGQEKMLHAPFAKRPPQRDVKVVLLP